MSERMISGAQALSRFSERFRQDALFNQLVRRDARAALAAVGIRVPVGIQIEFAPDAARAISIAVDGAPGRLDDALDLDDDQLQAVVGGTGRSASHDEVRAFLSLFKQAA
ncbi:hypothetical protein [Castellaniella denitrificans]|jgi:hypothetical protein|uniref:hypothetical protein n=1 Tax=Castellaniella denitrificans TaxID=56119 RepID=UPI001AC0DF90|nr:hypothetical protein [Burkholderiales bacterium]